MKKHFVSVPIVLALGLVLGVCSAPAAQSPTNTSAPTRVPAESTITKAPTPPSASPTAVPVSAGLAPGISVEGFGTIVGHTIAPFWDIADSGFGSLWLPHHENSLHPISRVDLETGELLAVIPVDRNGSGGSRTGRLFTSTATTEGMWVNDVLENALVLIDPDTNEIVREIEIGVAGLELAALEEAIWVTNPDSSSVLRIDHASGRVEARILLSDAGRLAVGEGSVWIVENRVSRVARIDPATNSLVAEIRVNSPEDLVVAEGSVWAATSDQPTAVTRIDPETNEVVASIPVEGGGGFVWGLEYGKGSLWVRVGPEGSPQCRQNFVARIDPATNAEISRMVLPCVAHIAFAGDYLWAVIEAPETMRRELNLPAGQQLTVRIEPD